MTLPDQSGWERWTSCRPRIGDGSFSGRFSSWGSQSSRRRQPPSSPIISGFSRSSFTSWIHRIGNLQLKDLDGDKVDDIIVTNNGRSRIDLLLSTKKADDDKASRPFRKDPNELEYDRRMRLVSIPVNKEVVSVDTGDFNGDGKPDLVFYGTPAEVEILFNEGKGHFGSPKKINTGDAVQRPAALAVADYDQDGRDDLCSAGRERTDLRLSDGPGRAQRAGTCASYRGQSVADQGGRPRR